MDAVVLRGTDLAQRYEGRGKHVVDALRGVSLELREGATLGIVGESGCGKSTLARLLVGLELPSAGTAEMGGESMSALNGRTRARRIQLVFQDPYSSLDPRQRVRNALREVLTFHRLHTGAEEQRIEELLDLVALGRRFADRYPHELSGGQAQRVAIARALAVEPTIIVLDEPTSALDVSVRAEIINLLIGIQSRITISYIFISHDLSMVRHVSDDIAVMYLGRIVESGSYDQVLDAPLHPYTLALAQAVPVPDPTVVRPQRVTSAITATSPTTRGCDYQDRCPLVEPHCREVAPTLDNVGADHRVACHVALRRARTP
ncbi:MAG: oligopeptide/dipeptide ABC transporter ATP-binding protein [Acidimicrobiales bacterium]